MKHLPVFLFIFCFGCSTQNNQKIIVPTLNAGFYSQALSKINDQLESDPSNSNLLEQKLYYCDQLGWPTNCLSALEKYKEQNGMTNKLIDQYLAYYEKHERYQLLLDLIIRWNEEFDLDERFKKLLIKSLAMTNQPVIAKKELRAYLLNNQREEDLAFASELYLLMKDTLMASYNLSKLHSVDPENKLMFEYGKLLIDLGYPDRGFEILNECLSRNESGSEVYLVVSNLFSQRGNLYYARELIKSFWNEDTIAFVIADLYQKELLWDSAVMYIDSVLSVDPLNKKAWWRRGRVYEEKGWLSYSMKFYEKMIEIDPVDSMALNRIEIIQRKIAYLQRLRDEQNQIPFLELKPIKFNN